MEEMSLADLRFDAKSFAQPANALDPSAVAIKEQTIWTRVL